MCVEMKLNLQILGYPYVKMRENVWLGIVMPVG